MVRAPDHDDPIIGTTSRDRPPRRSSTSAPSSSAPPAPAPAPSPYARLPPEYQDAFTSLQTTLTDEMTRQLGELRTHLDSRLDAQLGPYSHVGVGSYTQFGTAPYGSSQFAAPQYGTPQYGAPQFGASQFSGGGFSQFGAGSSYVPPVPPVYPPPSYPPRIIPDYGDDDADDDEDDDDEADA
ncbi:hypothetical protein Dimus_038045 [Dionaea muscipula]